MCHRVGARNWARFSNGQRHLWRHISLHAFDQKKQKIQIKVAYIEQKWKDLWCNQHSQMQGRLRARFIFWARSFGCIRSPALFLCDGVASISRYSPLAKHLVYFDMIQFCLKDTKLCTGKVPPNSSLSSTPKHSHKEDSPAVSISLTTFVLNLMFGPCVHIGNGLSTRG